MLQRSARLLRECIIFAASDCARLLHALTGRALPLW